MQPNDLIQLLEAGNVDIVDNQGISNNIADGCDVHALCGSIPGSESVIAVGFTADMPEANKSPELASTQDTLTFNVLNSPGVR